MDVRDVDKLKVQVFYWLCAGQRTDVFIDPCADYECVLTKFVLNEEEEKKPENQNYDPDDYPDPEDLYDDFDEARNIEEYLNEGYEFALSTGKGGPNQFGYPNQYLKKKKATSIKSVSAASNFPEALSISFTLDDNNPDKLKRKAVLKFYSCTPLEMQNQTCSDPEPFCKMVFKTHNNLYYPILQDQSEMLRSVWTVEKVTGSGNIIYKVTFPNSYPQIYFTVMSSCGIPQPPPHVSEPEELCDCDNCPDCPEEPVDPARAGDINPFLKGVWGNWRQYKSYIYYDRDNTNFKRSQVLDISGNLNSTNTKFAGELVDYQTFWQRPNGGEFWEKPTNLGPWTWNSAVTQYHPMGYEAENVNALDIYSSALYSNRIVKPIAVASNSKLADFLYDGFEDYDSCYMAVTCDENGVKTLTYYNTDKEKLNAMAKLQHHWDLFRSFNPYAHVSTLVAHTGSNSLKLGSTFISGINNYIPGTITIPIKPHIITQRFVDATFAPGTEDHLKVFFPTQTEYLISYWVKGVGPGAVDIKILQQNNSIAEITHYGPDMGNSVDGWYRVERKVVFDEVPTDEFVISFSTATGVSYIDDFRIQPMKSQVKSFVYDKLYHRLSASLDENNFASFFEYDLQGNLVRTKKETERGIYTITESRKNIHRYGN